MDTKSPLRSKTLWFNMALPLITVGAYYATGQVIPPEIAAAGYAAVSTIGNIILRLITKQPIEW